MMESALLETMSILALERRLGRLRERALTRAVVDHRPLSPEGICEEEAKALGECDRIRVGMIGAPKPGQGTPGESPPSHQTAKDAILFTHHRLLSIPHVGDPAFADDA